MQSPLQQNLIPAEINGFLDLLIQHIFSENVCFRMSDGSIEGTKVADRGTDIGIVDIPVDVESSVRLWVETVCHPVRSRSQLAEIVRLEKREPFFRREPFPGDSFLKDVLAMSFDSRNHALVPDRSQSFMIWRIWPILQREVARHISEFILLAGEMTFGSD